MLRLVLITHYKYMEIYARLSRDICNVGKLLAEDGKLSRYAYIERALGPVAAQPCALAARKQHGGHLAGAQRGKAERPVFVPVRLDLGYGDGGHRRKFAELARAARLETVERRKIHFRDLPEQGSLLSFGKFFVIVEQLLLAVFGEQPARFEYIHAIFPFV